MEPQEPDLRARDVGRGVALLVRQDEPPGRKLLVDLHSAPLIPWLTETDEAPPHIVPGLAKLPRGSFLRRSAPSRYLTYPSLLRPSRAILAALRGALWQQERVEHRVQQADEEARDGDGHADGLNRAPSGVEGKRTYDDHARGRAHQRADEQERHPER